jgi:predicted NodU family carbamoyl transferase
MDTVSLAVNLHDSCLTLSDSESVLQHLELERWSRQKRDVFKSSEQIAKVLQITRRALGRREEQFKLVVVNHVVNDVTDQYVEALASGRSDWSGDVSVIDHLESHAGLSMLSSFNDAVVLAIDGGGDATVDRQEPNAVAFLKRGRDLIRLGQITPAMGMLMDGRAWAVVSKRLFNDIHAAGKVMGLAGHSKNPGRFRQLFQSQLPRYLSWLYDDSTLKDLCAALPGDTFDDAADLAACLQEL